MIGPDGEEVPNGWDWGWFPAAEEGKFAVLLGHPDFIARTRRQFGYWVQSTIGFIKVNGVTNDDT